MKKVISVRFKENGKSYYFDPAGADIKTGEYVIVETARGIECGEVVQGVKEIADSAVSKAGDYEMGLSDGVVEQIIRPTGLLDPKIDVRPVKEQNTAVAPPSMI